ncbi:oligopeptide/dipeptide ABC transporter ATP-binding protein [Actinoplanes sp. NPDC051851]|uniref:oligopeptide/dipeptide ABC transporter ATP-binding protein n=1 Tax=Actinoplanes sp. NPDC051851 TaxID=3154753 RepID=UPI003420EE55
MTQLLAVDDLHVRFRGGVRAVDGVSFTVGPGETVGLVGESGSGKSTIGRVALGLQAPTSGTVTVDGTDVTTRDSAKKRGLARLRQVVFQDPYSSLNPSRQVGRTLTEPLEVQRKLDPTAALAEVNRLLGSVGLPKDAALRYPHSFSGGQRQRIALARSLSTEPRLIICDEAVSALDLVTRAQVLNLLGDLQRERELSLLFIAHDLPIVAHLSHRVVVLYRGRIMEQGPAAEIHDSPAHPYTKALMAAVPVPDPAEQRRRRAARVAAGTVSTATAEPAPVEGCPFAPRCPSATDVCWSTRPADVAVGNRLVACHLFAPNGGIA